MTTNSDKAPRKGRQLLNDSIEPRTEAIADVVESGDAAGGALTGTYPNPTLATDAVDAITEIAAALKSGSDATIITGTAGTNGDLAQWDANGDLVDGPTPPSGTIVGTSDSQTLTNKTINGDNNTLSNLDHGAEVDNPTVAHGATGAVVGTTNSQTLTNKTLTTPTIGDFSNAGHDHADAAGGGEVDVTDIGGVVFARKTSDDTISSDTTLSADTDLTFSIGANEVWMVEFVLGVTSTSTADFKAGIDAPSGATGRQWSVGVDINDADNIGELRCRQFSGSFGSGASSIPGATDTWQIIKALIVNSTTAGSVALIWAQNTSDAGNTTLQQHSYMVAMRLA